MSDLNRHSSAGPRVRRRAPVLPVVEAAVGDEQPVLLQLRVSRRPSARSPPALSAKGPIAARTAACDAHSLTVTTWALGNAPGAPSFPALGYPNAAAFAGMSGMSQAIPSMLMSRHRPRKAPAVSIVAVGLATCVNSSAIASGPSRWAPAPPVSRRDRQPATGPPGSYPGRTSTGRRRRAYEHEETPWHYVTVSPPALLGARKRLIAELRPRSDTRLLWPSAARQPG